MKISIKLIIVYCVFLLTLYNIAVAIIKKYSGTVLKKLDDVWENIDNKEEKDKEDKNNDKKENNKNEDKNKPENDNTKTLRSSSDEENEDDELSFNDNFINKANPTLSIGKEHLLKNSLKHKTSIYESK